MIDFNDLKNKKYIHNLMNKYSVESLAVIGPVAKGTNAVDNDLNLIVEFMGKRNLFKIIDLSQKLSEALGVKVALFTKDSISKFMKDSIEKEKSFVYRRVDSLNKTNAKKRELFKNRMGR